MAISLYEMSVPTYLQTLGAVSGILEKGLAHCKECNVAPGEVVEHRLFQDMAPFSFQIRSVAHHSLGAMEALKWACSVRPAGVSRWTMPACKSSWPIPRRRWKG